MNSRRIIAMMIIFALVLGVATPSPKQARADSFDPDDHDGINLYLDADYTKKLEPTIDLSGEYEAQYSTRICVPKNGEKKIYLRIKDSDYVKYRESDAPNTDLISATDDGEKLYDDSLISWEKDPAYTDTDKKYIVTLHGTDVIGHIRLQVSTQQQVVGTENWEDFDDDMDVIVDYVDDGLMISGHDAVGYESYYGEGPVFQSYGLSRNQTDYGREFATGVPGEFYLASLAVYRDGDLKIIRSQDELDKYIKIYRADGATEVDNSDFDIQKHNPGAANVSDTDAVLNCYISDDVKIGTKFIIRYTDGDYTSDLTYTADYPVVGMYSGSKMTVKNYLGETLYEEGKTYTTYILTKKKLENPTMQIQIEDINYADDALDTTVKPWVNIIDNNGVYGIKMTVKYNELPGKLKYLIHLSYEENGIAKRAKGSVLIDVPTPAVGDKKVIDGNTYKITKNRTETKLGTATLTKAKKNRIIDVVPYTVTMAGVAYYVNKIAKNAYKNNTRLTTLTIENKVTTIGKSAFSGCKKLKKITIYSSGIKSVGKNAFKSVPKSAVIKVPKNKKSAYKKLFKAAGFKGKIKS